MATTTAPATTGIHFLPVVAGCHAVTGLVCVGVIPPLGVASGSRLLQQFLGGLEAVRRALGQAAHDDRLERRRAGGAVPGHGIRRLGHVRGEDLLRGHPGKRRPPGQELVRHGAHGVDVHPVVEVRVGRGLLRRHVGRSAERHAGGGELLPAGRLAHRLGHAEIGDERVPAGEHHVVGLDVAVHHALAVGVGQRVHHLDQDLDRVVHRQLAYAREPLAERFALDVRHHEVEEAAGLAGVVERQDVRMLQAGRHLDFAEEPLAAERGGELGPQHLERHLAPVPEILGEVHRGHAAGADLPLDAVAVGEGGGEAGEGLGHQVSSS